MVFQVVHGLQIAGILSKAYPVDGIPTRPMSHQPKLHNRVLASPDSDSIWQFKLKIFTKI
jgi:hypothetical protein